MSHQLIDGDPALARIAREMAKLDEAQTADAHRREQASAAYWRAMAEHAGLAETAMLAGRAAPPAPPMPQVSGDPAVFLGRRRELTARRQEVMAERADLLLAALYGREDELLDAARQAGEMIARVAAEAQEVAAAVAVVRLAAGDPRPVYNRALSGSVLLSLIEAGARPSSPGRDVPGAQLRRLSVT